MNYLFNSSIVLRAGPDKEGLRPSVPWAGSGRLFEALFGPSPDRGLFAVPKAGVEDPAIVHFRRKAVHGQRVIGAQNTCHRGVRSLRASRYSFAAA